jgi:hypothetical protein
MHAYALSLDQHAGSVMALSAISAVITGEATGDWVMIRRAPNVSPLLGLEISLSTRLPFFMRTSVLLTAGFSLFAAKQYTGALRLLPPSGRPFVAGTGEG